MKKVRIIESNDKNIRNATQFNEIELDAIEEHLYDNKIFPKDNFAVFRAIRETIRGMQEHYGMQLEDNQSTEIALRSLVSLGQFFPKKLDKYITDTFNEKASVNFYSKYPVCIKDDDSKSSSNELIQATLISNKVSSKQRPITKILQIITASSGLNPTFPFNKLLSFTNAVMSFIHATQKNFNLFNYENIPLSGSREYQKKLNRYFSILINSTIKIIQSNVFPLFLKVEQKFSYSYERDDIDFHFPELIIENSKILESHNIPVEPKLLVFNPTNAIKLYNEHLSKQTINIQNFEDHKREMISSQALIFGIELTKPDSINKLLQTLFLSRSKISAVKIASLAKELLPKNVIQRAEIEAEIILNYSENQKKNTCPHIHLVQKVLNGTFREKEKYFPDLKKFYGEISSIITCNACGFPIMCPHLDALVEAELQSTERSKIIDALNKFLDTSNIHHKSNELIARCKYCSGMMYEFEDFDSPPGLEVLSYEPEILDLVKKESISTAQFLRADYILSTYRIGLQCANTISPAVNTFISGITPGKQISKRGKSRTKLHEKVEVIIQIALFVRAYYIQLIRQNDISFTGMKGKSFEALAKFMIKNVEQKHARLLANFDDINEYVLQKRLLYAFNELGKVNVKGLKVNSGNSLVDEILSVVYSPVVDYAKRIASIIEPQKFKPPKTAKEEEKQIKILLGDQISMIHDKNNDELEERRIILSKLLGVAYMPKKKKKLKIENPSKLLRSKRFNIFAELYNPQTNKYKKLVNSYQRIRNFFTFENYITAENDEKVYAVGNLIPRFIYEKVVHEFKQNNGYIYGKDGHKHSWIQNSPYKNNYIYKTRDGYEKNVPFHPESFIFVDVECNKCKTKRSEASKIFENNLKEINDIIYNLKEKDNLLLFFDIRCPEGELHEYNTGEDFCRKCLKGKLTDNEYYKKYKEIYYEYKKYDSLSTKLWDLDLPYKKEEIKDYNWGLLEKVANIIEVPTFILERIGFLAGNVINDVYDENYELVFGSNVVLNIISFARMLAVNYSIAKHTKPEWIDNHDYTLPEGFMFDNKIFNSLSDDHEKTYYNILSIILNEIDRLLSPETTYVLRIILKKSFRSENILSKKENNIIIYKKVRKEKKETFDENIDDIDEVQGDIYADESEMVDRTDEGYYNEEDIKQAIKDID